jgi:hypothetical protein
MEQILRESGRSWSVRRVRRHWQLLIEDFVVLTFPDRRKDASGHRDANALACVRRYLRGVTEC